MTKWREESLQEMTAEIVRLGLDSCNVCGSTENVIARTKPGFVHIGGIDATEKGANVLFAVIVECGTCGHMRFFNSERFHGPDVATLELES